MVLEGSPEDKWSTDSVCDPSVVKFRGTYFLYHTCINTKDSPDGYTNNRVCVATADSAKGPWFRGLAPVVQNLNCSKDFAKVYCIGQPSALVSPDGSSVFLYYSSIGAPGDPATGPNGGRILLATSSDGIHFTVTESETVYEQHNADVKLERSTNLFFMVQGDVGDTRISWAFSSDGKSFSPYSAQRVIETNPKLPSPCVAPCSNNNPGFASLPDGSFTEALFVQYGSSYPADNPWGAWHLFRSDVSVLPFNQSCVGCAPAGCDHACSRQLGVTSTGTCQHPGSVDPGLCCTCAPYSDPQPCSVCAPNGCNAACHSAGHKVGVCGDGRNPSDCCTCFD